MYMSPRLHADDVVIKRINKLSKNMCAKRRKEVPKQKGGEMGGVAGGLEPGGVTFRCVYGAYILALLYVLGRATNRNVVGARDLVHKTYFLRLLSFFRTRTFPLLGYFFTLLTLSMFYGLIPVQLQTIVN